MGIVDRDRCSLVRKIRFRQNRNHGAGCEDHFSTGQISHADLRALQVLKDGDRGIKLGGDGPQIRDIASVLFLGAVREIEPRHIHPGRDEPAYDFR
jgi:hypothetical protein